MIWPAIKYKSASNCYLGIIMVKSTKIRNTTSITYKDPGKVLTEIYIKEGSLYVIENYGQLSNCKCTIKSYN